MPEGCPPTPTGTSTAANGAACRAAPARPAPGRRGPLGAFKPLTARPATAEERAELGHWEGDLIIGAGHQSALAMLIDRLSRYTLLVGLPFGYRADQLLRALKHMPRRIHGWASAHAVLSTHLDATAA